jgi:hypothetical protein
MTNFIVGEQVVIRYGRQQGLNATIIKNRLPDAYMVKVADGSVRFYSGRGLEKAHEAVHTAAS